VGRDDDVPVGAVSLQRRSAGDIASRSILVVCSDDAVWASPDGALCGFGDSAQLSRSQQALAGRESAPSATAGAPRESKTVPSRKPLEGPARRAASGAAALAIGLLYDGGARLVVSSRS
jgi:hypothetical protein